MKLHASKTLPRTSAVILAGGQGERLHPLTASRPKPAVSFGGVFRIIDFTLSNCFHSGLECVSLLTQYRHEELHRYIRSGWSDRWNNARHRTPLVCFPPISGKRYRGTADAVFRNIELLRADDSEYVLILSGDHIYRMDYRKMVRQHMETQADLTIAAVQHPLRDASHFGVVEVDRDFKVTGFAEKPPNPVPLPCRPGMALVSMGVYVFRKKPLMDMLSAYCGEGRGFDFGHNIIPAMIPSGRTYAYDFREEASDSPRYWRDIGTVDAYYQASMDLMGPDAAFDPFATDEWPAQPARRPGTSTMHMRRHVTSKILNSVVSPDVQIAEGAMIEDSILLPGVRIGRGVRLRRAIVEEGFEIPARVTAGFDADHDRKYHTITQNGVVVISQLRSDYKPAVLHFALPAKQKEKTVMEITA